MPLRHIKGFVPTKKRTERISKLAYLREFPVQLSGLVVQLEQVCEVVLSGLFVLQSLVHMSLDFVVVHVQDELGHDLLGVGEDLTDGFPADVAQIWSLKAWYNPGSR